MVDNQMMSIIRAIGDRAEAMGEAHGRDIRAGYVNVAILTTHEKVVPLRLPELLDADDADFAHDVFGILRHLEPRQPGVPPGLSQCFMPRYAEQEVRHGTAHNG